MIGLIKRLIWDESAFVGLARGFLLAVASGMTMAGGEVRLPQTSGEWITVVISGAAGYLRSSSSPGASPQAPSK